MQSHLWGCDKGMGLGIRVIASCEVPVVGGDDCILLPFLNVFPARAERTGLEILSPVTWAVPRPGGLSSYGAYLALDRRGMGMP